ncbi:MAG: hypothetical protein NTY48_01210 [Candidatus Diapherotrites archaeon]|nr:hypothetical protein [Candidatus Diapherotrites archaeon]
MVFISRKIVYPFFMMVVCLVFFGLLFLVFFNQPVLVTESSYAVVGDKVILKMTLKNDSNYLVKGITISIKDKSGVAVLPIKGSTADSVLLPKESYQFVAPIILSENLSYSVTISAPFSRPVNLKFDLDPSVTNPVSAEVSLPPALSVGNKVSFPVKLCNKSPTDISDISWIEQASSTDFNDVFFPRTISLKKDECKTIYSSLTPIRAGTVSIGFQLKIGGLVRFVSKELSVS